MQPAPKSSVEEIRNRFDNDVERFSNLGTGQEAAMDGALAMDLISRAAAGATPHGTALLDVGCGAGNYSLKAMQYLDIQKVTLIDLSAPMLARAKERIGESAEVETIQADIREVDLPENHYDIILAAAVLHHLRVETEWKAVFGKFYRSLKTGGSVWIYDMVEHDHPAVAQLMKERYGDYLSGLRDVAYRDHVFGYIEKEDTPRSLNFQIDLLRAVGFGSVEILHKSGPFAAFGAIK